MSGWILAVLVMFGIIIVSGILSWLCMPLVPHMHHDIGHRCPRCGRYMR